MEIVYVKEKELFKVSKLSVGSVFRFSDLLDKKRRLCCVG